LCPLFNQGVKCVSGIGRILDRFAIGLSSLCVIHCLVPPLLLLLLPAVSLSFALPASFHIWMLLVAIPVSVLALRSGHRHHKQILPIFAAVFGLGLLGFGVIFIITAKLELLVTVAGALCLAGAHFWNASLAAASPTR
jgi:hypothetical protein